MQGAGSAWRAGVGPEEAYEPQPVAVLFTTHSGSVEWEQVLSEQVFGPALRYLMLR